jgi:phasin family protein
MNAQQTFASFEEFSAPMIALNKIALSYTEKLVDLNLTVARKQVDVTLAAWREALAVKDPDAAKAYLTHQSEVARNVVEGYVADAKTVNDMNREVAEDVRKVVEESISKATSKAA